MVVLHCGVRPGSNKFNERKLECESATPERPAYGVVTDSWHLIGDGCCIGYSVLAALRSHHLSSTTMKKRSLSYAPAV